MKNIIISGPDGTGKSSIAKAVIKKFSEKNIKLEYVWLRFNHYLSKLLNLIGRISGKSFYENYSWGKIGYHHYHGIIGFFYVISIYLDQLIFNLIFRKFFLKKNKRYLIDRFVIDSMADLIVDTKRTNMIILLFGPYLVKELNNSNAFILQCDKQTVISRRPDIIDDKCYDMKIHAYKLIASKFNIPIIDTQIMSINKASELILNKSIDCK